MVLVNIYYFKCLEFWLFFFVDNIVYIYNVDNRDWYKYRDYV